ncbi:N-acyl-aromatic-L-amino acid amidohydrolase (carboxylate-forming) A-like [Lepisosteus oculatus]|uniref:N-acyl-aromatic-L-amino acid amidohydrolase (carboxylate-forming) A-like n=1 Tax=Lepisosteus oculatus TaxID=7918 RepID=UPI00371E31AF
METDSSPPLQLPRLSSVVVSGGTHGNELSGVYLVRDGAPLLQRPSFTARTVLANPQAVERCSRYVDVDLNRCFTSATLSAPLTEDSPYEVKRAQELNSNLGPKGTAQAADLLCDLHNTTANMGVCLIGYSDSDWLSLQFYKYLQMKMSHVPVRFLIFNLPPSESYSLESVGKHGFAIEVGPQPQGVLRADIFIQMKEGITHLLDFIELFNTGTVFPSCEVDMYRSVGNIDYPRDPRTQHIAAAVHPDRQDRDFSLLSPGDALFLSFSGETLPYTGERALYPYFINEGAYYEKGIALSLAERYTVQVPSIMAQSEG